MVRFSQKDLDDFWHLNTETTNRDRSSGHELLYYKHFLTELKDYAVLFLPNTKGNVLPLLFLPFVETKLFIISELLPQIQHIDHLWHPISSNGK